MKYIIDLPKTWKIMKFPAKYIHIFKAVLNATKATEVRFDYDPDCGLSVIDENGVFHFEGQDKYYAVEDK